jgi:hypothetical protein
MSAWHVHSRRAARRRAQRTRRSGREPSHRASEGATGTSPAAAKVWASTLRIPQRLRRKSRQVEPNPTKTGWAGGAS